MTKPFNDILLEVGKDYEIFCCESAFHQWIIRRYGVREFGKGWYFDSKVEALAWFREEKKGQRLFELVTLKATHAYWKEKLGLESNRLVRKHFHERGERLPRFDYKHELIIGDGNE